MIITTWFRINDFLSVNSTHNANGKGSGYITSVTAKEVTTLNKITGEVNTLQFDDMTMLRAPMSSHDLTQFISVSYYWR
jgi:hypothetical protein